MPPLVTAKALAKFKVVAEAVPATSSLYKGLVVPIPTFPLAKTVRYWALEEEATVKIGKVGLVEEPWTTNMEFGVVELKPNNPVEVNKALVTLLVSKARALASLVPKLAWVPKELPFWIKAEAAEAKPKVVVATHWVEVPVVCKTMPEVPLEPVLS